MLGNRVLKVGAVKYVIRFPTYQLSEYVILFYTYTILIFFILTLILFMVGNL